MPITHVADNYLAVFQNGGEFQGGLAFQKALSQANLDFSPESLGRIDLLLTQIRERVKPEFDAFLDKVENQNFLHLLAFYAGEVVARKTGLKKHWLDHPELLEVVQDKAAEYPYCFATSITCYFENGAFFLPFSAIQERLFEPNSTRSLKEAAARYMQPQGEPPKLERSSAIPSMVPGPVAAEVKMLANFSGMAAAFAVFQIAEGGAYIPTLSHDTPGGIEMTALMREDLNEAIDEGQQRLAANPEGVARAALVYDGFINLPGRRTDALVLEARSYGVHGFAFSVALPYRHAREQGGFAIYTARLLSFALDSAHQPLLAASFFAGFDKFNPQGMWKKYFDASL
jgi:hypothetical protein